MTTTPTPARPAAPAGRERPEPPSGQLVLKAPPRLQPGEGVSGVALTAIPMLGSLGSVVLVATITRSAGASSEAGVRSLLAAGMFLLATVGFVVLQVDRQRRQRGQQVSGSRTEYLRYLAGVRSLVRQAGRQQRDALTWHHPAPEALPALAEERSRVWERGGGDPRRLHVRWGTSTQALTLELVPPDSTTEDHADPAAVSALHRLLQVHRVQPDLPAALDLRAVDRVAVHGPDDRPRALARALVCQATAFHAPDQLVVAVLCAEEHLARWDWLKWLPHALSAEERDAVGPMRMVSASATDLAAMLPAGLRDRPPYAAGDRSSLPHVLLVLDGVEAAPGGPVVPPGGLDGVTVLDLPRGATELDDPHRVRVRLGDDADADGRVPAELARLRQAPVLGRADQCDIATAEAFARRLTPLQGAVAAPGADAAGAATGPADVMDLLGLGDVHAYEPRAAWRTRPARDRLRVPVGLGERGAPVHLDLKESAQQGMGPHGLVIGATGSGKSEFLRTLVLGLALTHPPDQLNLVLVDFKGGATFTGMADLPHVSAVITNLADDLTLVDRMQDALTGELVRRQEVLRRAGSFASVRDYERARAAGEDLVPLPSLLIVVDEFSEMLSAKPEFLELFVTIGRTGRSLGLHLLLASQRLEEGRLRGLESHLSYRVGLRTFSAQESRAVLGVPDAYELPAVPGLGLLKPDPATLTRFQAAYVSAPPVTTRRPAPRDEGGHLRGILPFSISEVVAFETDPDPEPVPAGDADGSAPEATLLEVAVRRLAGQGTPAHQVWLPPLDRPDTLDRLVPDLVEDPALGLVSPRWRAAGGLVVPLGTIDRPREQRRDTLTVDLTGAAGHVGVVGGPRSGKSTALRTLVTTLSLVATPLDATFFVLDLGGGALGALAGLPHVAGVATRGEPDAVRRAVAQVQAFVDRREEYFRTEGIDSVESYRTRRAQGRADDGHGDVFLVVDGWGGLRSDFDDLEPVVQALAARGLAFGLHVVASATRWADFRAAMRDVLGTRVELRLGDPTDSEVDRRAAALVPTGRAGRGLVAGGLHVLTALPRIDGDGDPASAADGLAALVARSRAAWRGPEGPKLRLLPDVVGLDRVLELAGLGPEVDQAAVDPALARRLHLGVDEKQLAPVALDPDTEPHLLVLGDGGSGKSALLRALCREVVRGRTPQDAQLVVVDYRRSLLGEVPEDFLLDYLTSAAQAGPALRELATYLESRLPGGDVTPEQLRNRSWWTGAEVFVVVDDYDLVSTQQASPVAVLQPLLAQARDVGLHLVVARRSGGASRALYEPVIQGIRDLAMPQLLLSGSPDEGPLVGNLRPTPLPPGRGRLVTRERGVETVQTAWTEPSL
ncbi:type VII secretion protein EccCa [Nocardioides litoris]|uniref:type VII secretion protein EccCa n=1 Tax=Nocardioides litoris TaxID=1926648 RepID=UPI00111F2A0C|nr:type VII secretion protein EccCa [Nocardioides litoris]